MVHFLRLPTVNKLSIIFKYVIFQKLDTSKVLQTGEIWSYNKTMTYRYRVLVWDDERFLVMDRGEGCLTMWMYLMPLSCTLKNA